MAQWVNHLQNNIFVNPLPLPLLWSPTPTATGSYGRQAGIQNTGKFRKFQTCL